MVPENFVINAPVYDAMSYFGILGMSVIVAIIWVFMLARNNRKKLIILSISVILVMSISAYLATSGILANFKVFPPPMAIMIVGLVVISFIIGLSSFGKEIALGLSFSSLVGLQIFRLPLELIMHHASNLGIMPPQLSFSGFNFDIITGTGALIIFALIKIKKETPLKLIWLWNIWGSYCLIAIIVIAITTSPMMRLFGDDLKNLNTWVLYFPYIWLPVVLVTIAISSHIIIWRKLLIKNIEVKC